MKKEELTKKDWEANLFNNRTLIKTNLMQIEMAEKIIELCEEKIKEFPEEPDIPKEIPGKSITDG